jgi:hypothetical protein
MREGGDSSVCCLLQPYSKSGFRNGYGGQNRAVIFAAGGSPQLFPGEEPPDMGQFPVIIEKPSVTIDPALRLDFSRVYTIEHYVKVRNVGRIDRNFLKELKAAFLKAMGGKPLESDNRQAGFESNNAGNDEVKNLAGYNSDRPMFNRMGASFGGYFETPTTPSNSAAEHTRNASMVDHGGIPIRPSFATSVLPRDLARGYTYNKQVVDNMGAAAEESSVRFGPSNGDTPRSIAPAALTPYEEDRFITASFTEEPLHRGIDRLGIESTFR